MKVLNINKKYKKLAKYSYVLWVSRDDYQDDFYWFDKKSYKFIHNEKLIRKGNIDKNRYVRFVWFDPAYHVKDFYYNNIYNDTLKKELMSIDDDEKLMFFMASVAGDNDYSNEFLFYNEYLVLTEMIVNWCKNHNINYKFEVKKPSEEYLGAPHLKADYRWRVPKRY